MSVKTAAILLVLLVLLSLGGLCSPLLSGGDSELPPAWLEGLGDTLVPQCELQPQRLMRQPGVRSCLKAVPGRQDGSLRVLRGCSLLLPESSMARILALRPRCTTRGETLELELEGSDSMPRQRLPLAKAPRGRSVWNPSVGDGEARLRLRPSAGARSCVLLPAPSGERGCP